MKTELFQTIIEYLNQNNIKFELFKHEPVYTSATASTVLGHTEKEGTKSLALKTEKGLVVVTVSGIERVDFKVLKQLLDVKKIEMCDTDIINKDLGTEVGGLAPFGYQNQIQIVVSHTLFNQNSVYFNPGRNDATIRVGGKVFKTITLDHGAKVIPEPMQR
jgi:Ala-tRNA(Pro) deacylase